MLNDLDNLLILLASFKNKHKFNPFDNYHYRDLLVYKNISKIDGSYLPNTNSRGGYDFHNSRTDKGECKTSKIYKSSIAKYQNQYLTNACCLEFDKQTDKKRQIETLEYGAFSFGLIDAQTEKIVFTLYLNNETAVNEFRQIIINKQNKFDEFCESNKFIHKRVYRDAIRFSVRDIININSIVIQDENAAVINKDDFLNRVVC